MNSLNLIYFMAKRLKPLDSATLTLPPAQFSSHSNNSLIFSELNLKSPKMKPFAQFQLNIKWQKKWNKNKCNRLDHLAAAYLLHAMCQLNYSATERYWSRQPTDASSAFLAVVPPMASLSPEFLPGRRHLQRPIVSGYFQFWPKQIHFMTKIIRLRSKTWKNSNKEFKKFPRRLFLFLFHSLAHHSIAH